MGAKSDMTHISVVIPLFNEEDNIEPLWMSLNEIMKGLGHEYELLMIDDGSTDGTLDVISSIAERDDHAKVISFRRNFGQTAALMAGFDHAQGDIVVAMDGDGQNDPADIPALLSKMDEGYDVVSGWRKERHDPAGRMLASRMANWLISRISGIHLHDYGCTLKAYRRDVLKDVRLYGEMHRLIPIYTSWHGGNIAELVVTHHPRRHGTSKYGISRSFKVILDLVVVRFMQDYSHRPIYVFGLFGLLNFVCGFVSGIYALWLKFGEGRSFINTPMPLLVVFFMILGIMAVLMGLLAEMVMRTYFEAQNKPSYSVKQTRNLLTVPDTKPIVAPPPHGGT